MGYCGKSPKPSYSMLYILVGKELSGVAVPNVSPRLGRLRPRKRASRPPLGFAGLPMSEKFRVTPGGRRLPSGVLVGLSACISSDAMTALCE